MKQPFLYIANWKMNSSFEQSITFSTHNKDSLLQLGARSNSKLVITPSFTSLHAMAQIFANSAIHIGAQNCSEHEHGSYTGQVDARSLAQIGCTYCIVGHSESRAYCHETNEQIGIKVKRLLEQNIIPIICIGENKTEYEQGKTYTFLEEQLLPISKALNKSSTPNQCVIAYEPIWSIGTGIVPPTDYLVAIFTWLHEYCASYLANTNVHYVYGGSVNENNISQLKNIEGIEGFLIGSASLDFQKLQKIIVCTY
jgi:triosephosphate isomerase